MQTSASPTSAPRTSAGRSSVLEAALKRLSSALDLLEAATERVGGIQAERRDLEDTLAAMQDDRSRLAERLDAALVRSQTLQRATDEVAARLGRTGATLRRLLASGEEAA